MAGTSVLYVNDYDTALLGLVVETVTGYGDTPGLTRLTRGFYGRAGLAVTAPNPTLAPRVITVTGTLLASTVAAFNTALDALKALFASTAEVRLSSDATRCWTVDLTDLKLSPLPGPQLITPASGIALTLTALDPYGYDVNWTAVALGAVAQVAPLGTAPSAPLLRLSGAATNPVVTVRNAQGVAVGSIGLTLTLAAGDFVELDCDAMTIAKSVSGSVTDALTTLASGDWPLLNPADGAVTVEVNSGTGEALYRKAWR
jgi:hypothetical protein